MAIFFPNELFVFLVFRSFSKIRILVNIFSCEEINLFEFRSKVKNPHASEVWVNFTTQLGLFIKIWAENTFFTCGRDLSP